MNHRFANDPELKKYLRIRSYTGALVLLAVSAGITTISATSPPAPAPVVENCMDPAAPPVFNDAAPGLAPCKAVVSHDIRPAAKRATGTTALPAVAADARADDPPVPTF